MSAISAPEMTGTLHRASAGSWGRLTGTAPALLALAASGSGMAEIAAECYADADWRLVRVAVHESGHAAVGRAYGLAAEIEIAQHEYGGHCTLSGWALQRADVRRQVGLAGEISYHEAAYGRASDIVIFRHLEAGTMSASDETYAADYTLAHVRETAALVRQLWPEIIGQASAIVETELVKRGAA